MRLQWRDPHHGTVPAARSPSWDGACGAIPIVGSDGGAIQGEGRFRRWLVAVGGPPEQGAAGEGSQVARGRLSQRRLGAGEAGGRQRLDAGEAGGGGAVWQGKLGAAAPEGRGSGGRQRDRGRLGIG